MAGKPVSRATMRGARVGVACLAAFIAASVAPETQLPAGKLVRFCSARICPLLQGGAKQGALQGAMCGELRGVLRGTGNVW